MSLNRISRPDPGLLPGVTRVLDVSDAFRELVEEHYAAAVKFVMFYGGSLADAQDAVQEAFLEAWILMSGNGASAIHNPRAWIKVVACRKYRRPTGPRNQAPTVLMPRLPELADPDGDPGGLSALVVSVRAALGRLDDRLRLIMLLRLEDLSDREIAVALSPGEPPAEADIQHVRDQLKKARKTLREELGDPDEGWKA